jgi:hypothetical protein
LKPGACVRTCGAAADAGAMEANMLDRATGIATRMKLDRNVLIGVVSCLSCSRMIAE